jgi:hypothetical protein
MERVDKDKRRVPFSLKFVKASTGEIVTVKEAVCTSSSNGNVGGTVNIMFKPSMEIRKVRVLSIIEFNGFEVFY